MKRIPLLFACLCLMAAGCSRPAGDTAVTTVTVQKIWDEGTHAAFTSLIKFNGKYYCSFREGWGHVFDDSGKAEGKVRILCSKDGASWQSAADIGMEGTDLRDPKLSVTPDGRLMVTIGGSIYRDGTLVGTTPQVCFSQDGKHFSDLQPIEIDPAVRSKDDWLWRVTWHEDTGYGVNYRGGKVMLLSTKDGIRYDLVCPLDPPAEIGDEQPLNESTVRFLPDGRMAVLIRRDPGTALLAVAPAPFREWTWRELPLHIGGPDFLVREDGSLIIGGRSYLHPGHVRTVLYKGTVDGALDERYILLPSGGDTSYPGLLIEDGKLWVSYYSAEGASAKTAIFLATLPLTVFD